MHRIATQKPQDRRVEHRAVQTPDTAMSGLMRLLSELGDSTLFRPMTP